MAAKVSEYKIVEGNGRYPVESEVNKLLAEGWELHGSISTVADEKGTVHYYQPMVKRGRLPAGVENTVPRPQ